MKAKTKRLLSAVPALLGLLLILGCSVRQEVSLDLSGGGEVAGEIVLHPVLTSYLEDLSMAMGGEVEGALPLFDLPGIRSAFAENEGIELESLSSPRREVLRFALQFDDLNTPFEALPPVERNIFEFRREGERRSLHMALNRENFSQISAYFPVMDEAVLAYFLPQGDQPVSEELYKDDLSYALEDYLGGDSLEEILDTSSIRIAVGFDGTLVEQRGGRVDGERVVFSIPLLKILLLNEPLEYSLTFLP